MEIGELDKPENALRKELILWYYDRWMPVSAGKHWWRDEIKMNKLLTDLAPVGSAQKVNVTVTSEAMGLLGWENYRDKWVKQFQYKEKHGPDAEFPKAKDDKDEDGNGIEYYSAKWSDSNAGQKKFGGWHDDAYKAFENFKTWVANFREVDAKEDRQFQQHVLKLIQEKHKKKLDRGAGKKRRRGKASAEPQAPPPKKVTRLDE